MSSYPAPTRMIQQVQERVGERLMLSWPVKDLPLNIRPVIIFITAGWLILLGVLGMAPIPRLVINDKALHFFGMGFATFLVYFIIEVPEGPARRVWYIRRAPLILTLITSFFFGSVVSEFVQGMLPWKEFQWGDILANLLGSTLFLYLAHLLAQRHRKRAELSTLYQPLSNSSTYRDARGREHAFRSSSGSRDDHHQPPREAGGTGTAAAVTGAQRGRAGSNVWDEASDAGEEGRRSEVFEIGGEDDDEGGYDRDREGRVGDLV